MAGRAIWKGVITFGVVTVPVKLYTALEPQRVSFHLLHDQDQERLRQEMVCPVEEKPVEREEIVKGYEVDRNEYVVVEPEEIDEVEPEASRAIEVRQFVDPGEIDPRYWDRPYFLGPDGDAGAVATLAAALREEDLAGICQWVMRKRSYLGALRLVGPTLCLMTMHYATEIVPVASLELPAAKVDARELKVADYLIETLSAEWDPSQYVNEYDDRVRELVAAKARGEKVKVVRPRRPRTTRSNKLLETLEASVAAAKKKRKQHA